MRSAHNHAGKLIIAAALSTALLTSACGGGDATGNVTDVQMKGLETADGTINDAMTDLDGVQSEGTAMVQTGNNVSATAGSTGNEGTANASAAAETEAEVVADQ